MIEILASLEIKEIASIVTKFVHACQQVLNYVTLFARCERKVGDSI